MPIVPTATLDILRNAETVRQELYLSIVPLTVKLTAVINDASATRGSQSFTYGSGAGDISDLSQYMEMWVGTAAGKKDVAILPIRTISGTAASGTITLFEHGEPLQNGLHISVFFYINIEVYQPFLTPTGETRKFYNISYTDQNEAGAPPVVDSSEGDTVLTIVGGTATLNVDISNSYAIAIGATITSYGCSVKPTAGTTVTFNTSLGTGTVDFTIAGFYIVYLSATDSNGNTSTIHVYVVVHDNDALPINKFELIDAGESFEQGASAKIVVKDDAITFSDIPETTIAIIWYKQWVDEVELYPALPDINPQILMTGYTRKEVVDASLGQDVKSLTIEITTVSELINSVNVANTSLTTVANPTKWTEYPDDLTCLNSTHHMLRWHSSVLFRHPMPVDWPNELKAKTILFEQSTLLETINNTIFSKGIFARLRADRFNKLHFAVDAQYLNTTERATLQNIFQILPEDFHGDLSITRRTEEDTYAAQVDGFSYDGFVATPLVSIIPGYFDSTTGKSVFFFKRRGTKPVVMSGMILASQTDSNQKVGRVLAVENNPIDEIRINFKHNFLPLLTTTRAYGFYTIDISNTQVGRELDLDVINVFCNQILVSYAGGALQITGIFKPEAIGPDGIRGNYPTSQASSSTADPNQWEVESTSTAIMNYGSSYFKIIGAAWQTITTAQSFLHGTVDPWWRFKMRSHDPRHLIWWNTYTGNVVRTITTVGEPQSRKPSIDPPNTQGDPDPPTVDDLDYLSIVADPWVANRWYLPANYFDAGLSEWRSWIYITSDDGVSWDVIDADNGGDEARVLWATVNASYLILTIWTDDGAGNTSLRLDIRNKSTLAIVQEYELEDNPIVAAIDQRSAYAFPVRVIDDPNLIYIGGRFTHPVDGLTHVAKYDLSTFTQIITDWGGDRCASLTVRETRDTTRTMTALRENQFVWE